MHLIQHFLKILAGYAVFGKIEKHKVIVGSARYYPYTALFKLVAKHGRIFDYLFLIFGKLDGKSLPESHRLCVSCPLLGREGSCG